MTVPPNPRSTLAHTFTKVRDAFLSLGKRVLQQARDTLQRRSHRIQTSVFLGSHSCTAPVAGQLICACCLARKPWSNPSVGPFDGRGDIPLVRAGEWAARGARIRARVRLDGDPPPDMALRPGQRGVAIGLVPEATHGAAITRMWRYFTNSGRLDFGPTARYEGVGAMKLPLAARHGDVVEVELRDCAL